MSAADTASIQSLVLKILNDAKDLFVTLLDATGTWPLYAGMVTVSAACGILLLNFLGHPFLGSDTVLNSRHIEQEAFETDRLNRRHH